MPYRKIGDYAAIAGALSGTEMVEVQTEANESKHVTAQQIANLAPGAPVIIQFAASDELTALTTGTAKVTFRVPFAFTLTAVRCSLSAPSTSGDVATMLNVNGSAALSTGLTIDVGEKTSMTAAVPAVISTAAIPDDAEITVDVTGAGTGATGLKVTLIGAAS